MEQKHNIPIFNGVSESGICFSRIPHPSFETSRLLKVLFFYFFVVFFSPQTAFSRAFLYSHGCGPCTVVNKAAGYLQQHLPALFPLVVSTLGLNISCCVFSGGLSGGAEEEEGSLPPAAVRRLTGPLPSDLWDFHISFFFML